MSEVSLVELPDDIIFVIASHLVRLRGLISMAAVCRRFRDLMSRFHPHSLSFPAFLHTDVMLRANPFIKLDRIERLSFTDSTWLTDSHLANALPLCREFLCELNITGCQHLTDQSCRAIATHCHALTALNISGCAFSGSAVIDMLKRLPGRLQRLNIRHCDHVTDQEAETLASLVDVLYVVELVSVHGSVRSVPSLLLRVLTFSQANTTDNSSLSEFLASMFDSVNASMHNEIAPTHHGDVLLCFGLPDQGSNQRSFHAKHLLLTAASFSNIHAARLLVRCGADLTVRCECGLTCLHIVLQNTHDESQSEPDNSLNEMNSLSRDGYRLALWLVRAGASVLAVDQSGLTAFHHAVRRGSSQDKSVLWTVLELVPS
eukprot:c9853_g1_i2.p1 GENE.c9853_g1_i2~~c9853_g1_i2.p1  ORF type:complete len:387 (+),score=101.17 c9853_g1_i2:40-1161(+)